jgi:hypothetical protein
MRSTSFAFLLLATANVFAAPVTWTLGNVTLTSGGSITGSFDYDSDTNTYSNIAIESPCWYEMCPEYTGDNWTYSDWHEYIYGTLPAGGSIEPVSNMTSTSLSLASGAFGFGTFYGAELALVFATELTNAGGMIALVPNTDYLDPGDLDYYNEYTGEYFYLASGSITAVPIPAAVWLFGSGLAGLGWIRRKQKA